MKNQDVGKFSRNSTSSKQFFEGTMNLRLAGIITFMRDGFYNSKTIREFTVLKLNKIFTAAPEKFSNSNI